MWMVVFIGLASHRQVSAMVGVPLPHLWHCLVRHLGAPSRWVLLWLLSWRLPCLSTSCNRSTRLRRSTSMVRALGAGLLVWIPVVTMTSRSVTSISLLRWVIRLCSSMPFGTSRLAMTASLSWLHTARLRVWGFSCGTTPTAAGTMHLSRRWARWTRAVSVVPKWHG